MSNAITLIQFKGEARADSRLLAKQLGNQHKNSMDLIERYAAKFKRFGHLPFQTEVGKRIQGGGKAERFALLNEDQCYFLLSLSRNTDIVVDLKADLIAAFREARDRASVTDAQYLPLYHAMHDEVSALARRAKECGSNTPERMFHINVNKALNAVMGIASGERGTLTIEQRLLLTTLQAVWRNHLHASLGRGDDHREAFGKAKDAVLAYMTGVGTLLLGGRAA
ncbi:Rha family transcriptional regulator [Azotobacter beijerinckii]|uniref:Rha family transcriptional regulator n=1 Tax=Azotobacter beijerinckii TaxID=170623 RepID=UPI0029552805|nr:Rha family transcriptional regulator [Azotobacter beijerinckii]MDV7212923.1 Rha family transcriptional regulator [Azotobacter beijerinckii]